MWGSVSRAYFLHKLADRVVAWPNFALVTFHIVVPQDKRACGPIQLGSLRAFPNMRVS